MNKKYFLALPFLALVFLVLPQAGFAVTCDDYCTSGKYGGGACTTTDSGCDFSMGPGGFDDCSQSEYCCCTESGIIIEDAEEEGTITASSALVPDCVLSDPKSCGLCDLVQFIVDATQFLAGAVAGLALLMFVIGGFYWIFSAGNEQRVTTGKKIMIGSITGVVIVFLAWIIVNTLVIGLSVGGEGWSEEDSAKLFPGPNPVDWFQVECTQYEK